MRSASASPLHNIASGKNWTLRLVQCNCCYPCSHAYSGTHSVLHRLPVELPGVWPRMKSEVNCNAMWTNGSARNEHSAACWFDGDAPTRSPAMQDRGLTESGKESEEICGNMNIWLRTASAVTVGTEENAASAAGRYLHVDGCKCAAASIRAEGPSGGTVKHTKRASFRRGVGANGWRWICCRIGNVYPAFNRRHFVPLELSVLLRFFTALSNWYARKLSGHIWTLVIQKVFAKRPVMKILTKTSTWCSHGGLISQYPLVLVHPFIRSATLLWSSPCTRRSHSLLAHAS